MISDLFRHEHPDTRNGFKWWKDVINSKPHIFSKVLYNEDNAICEYCGIAYYRRNRTKKTCSNECRMLMFKDGKSPKKIIKQAKIYKRICKNCNKPFETYNQYSKMCGTYCKIERKRKQDAERHRLVNSKK